MRIQCLLFIHESFGEADELRNGLSREYVVSTAPSETVARALLEQERFDVVIVMTGVRREEIAAFLEWVGTRQPDADRLLLHRREDGTITSDFSAAGDRPATAASRGPAPKASPRPAPTPAIRWGSLRGANRHRVS